MPETAQCIAQVGPQIGYTRGQGPRGLIVCALREVGMGGMVGSRREFAQDLRCEAVLYEYLNLDLAWSRDIYKGALLSPAGCMDFPNHSKKSSPSPRTSTHKAYPP